MNPSSLPFLTLSALNRVANRYTHTPFIGCPHLSRRTRGLPIRHHHTLEMILGNMKMRLIGLGLVSLIAYGRVKAIDDIGRCPDCNARMVPHAFEEPCDQQFVCSTHDTGINRYCTVSIRGYTSVCPRQDCQQEEERVYYNACDEHDVQHNSTCDEDWHFTATLPWDRHHICYLAYYSQSQK
ncbi:hypothetical protein PCASD_16963 [Puccinia coronata f. sp. avenae]|uniref:Uncharacterized protein n=1 Tax=Puccinia coronata f. sp. avenae TaxID=200324 RepID=A0A2N5T1L4_9BASI|nr:hypothetical protein PCASD_16963 [Puccinia coronata f. sp. avenae]